MSKFATVADFHVSKTEYLPSIKSARESDSNLIAPPLPLNGEGKIGFCNITFSWDSFESKKKSASDGSKKRKPFKLQFDGEVIFKPGCVNLILGPTASGKVHVES